MDFEKHTVTCIYHYIIMQSSLTALKIPCILPIHLFMWNLMHFNYAKLNIFEFSFNTLQISFHSFLDCMISDNSALILMFYPL